MYNYLIKNYSLTYLLVTLDFFISPTSAIKSLTFSIFSSLKGGYCKSLT